MTQEFDSKAHILALGDPPRSFPDEMTRRLPRVPGLWGPVGFGGAAALFFTALVVLWGDPDLNVPIIAAIGAAFLAVSVWLFTERVRTAARFRRLLMTGRRAIGFVKDVSSSGLENGSIADHYSIEFVDSSKRRHEVSAFWPNAEWKFPPGARMIVLHDLDEPGRIGVYPLDYPDLKLKLAPRPDPLNDPELRSLAANYGATPPASEGAFVVSLVQTMLNDGAQRLAAGDVAFETLDSFDQALSIATRAGAPEPVLAMIHAKRGSARASLGFVDASRHDFQKALALDSSQAEATECLRRLG